MKSKKIIFPLFLAITLVTYFATIGAGFVFDFLGWQRVYDLGSFSDIINCFGYRGNHQTLHFFFYSIYSIFHLNGLAWYIIFCGLHAFNGWLLYNWLITITARWQLKSAPLLMVLIGLLFIVHPYNVEPVVWKPCIHYLLSLTAILYVLQLVVDYIKTKNQKTLGLILLIYGLSFFLLELSYITPLVITCFLVVDAFATKDLNTIKSRIIGAGGLWAILILGLLLNRWTLGAWVGHYGAETHLQLNVIGMMSTEIKYFFKHLFDARYFPFAAKNLLFDTILSNPELVFFFLVGCIATTILYVLKIKKVSGYIHLVFWGTLASALYTLPISNLFFYHLMLGTNDRFSYVPLVFCLVAVYAFLSKTQKWFWLPLLSILIVVQVYFQHYTIRQWKESTVVVQNLRDTFRWHDRSHVFVLNSPDNLNGIVMTSVRDVPSGIEELLDYQTDTPFEGIMYDVLQYNMTTPNDGVTVEQTGPMQLRVTFKQWGNWWHYHGNGASVYENEFYKAEVLNYPYQLTFKKLPEGSAIIYQDGKEWKEFEFSQDTLQ